MNSKIELKTSDSKKETVEMLNEAMKNITITSSSGDLPNDQKSTKVTDIGKSVKLLVQNFTIAKVSRILKFSFLSAKFLG